MFRNRSNLDLILLEPVLAFLVFGLRLHAQTPTAATSAAHQYLAQALEWKAEKAEAGEESQKAAERAHAKPQP